jgi:hypothetical protein
VLTPCVAHRFAVAALALPGVHVACGAGDEADTPMPEGEEVAGHRVRAGVVVHRDRAHLPRQRGDLAAVQQDGGQAGREQVEERIAFHVGRHDEEPVHAAVHRSHRRLEPAPVMVGAGDEEVVLVPLGGVVHAAETSATRATSLIVTLITASRPMPFSPPPPTSA